MSSSTNTSAGSHSIVRQNKFNNSDETASPTLEAYGSWQFLFDYFNHALFDGNLPDVLVTLSRQHKALGYFWAEKFQNKSGVVIHEIGMNPAYLHRLGDTRAISTLVHEMTHQWRHVFGPNNQRGGRGCNGYHDKPWSNKMEEIGLLPTDNGKFGGKKTGYRVSHLVVIDGPFHIACRKLLESGFQIDWHDRMLTPADENGEGNTKKSPRKKARQKFTCSTCELNAWAKPTARLICAVCDQPMHFNIT